MPFTINLSSNLKGTGFQDLDNQERAFYSAGIAKLPEKPTKDDILNLLAGLPVSKTLDFLNLFKSEMSKKAGGKLSAKQLVSLYSLLPDKILWYEENYNCFSEEYLNQVCSGVLDAKYLRKSNLSEPFKTTYGFDVQFKSEYKDQVIKYFPLFKDYIEEIYSEDITIYYLNALVLGLNSHVMNHYDQTIRKYSPETITFPERVSVLYVDVPEMTGGDFILYQNDQNRIFGRIKPEKNKLLYFKGCLAHEILGITEVKSEDKKHRISLVCEQYKVDKQTLKKIPNFLTNVPRTTWFKLNS